MFIIIHHFVTGIEQYGRLSFIFRQTKRGHIRNGKRSQFESQSRSERKSAFEPVHFIRIGIVEYNDEETGFAPTTLSI